MDEELNWVQAYLGGLFDDDCEISENETDPDDLELEECFGGTLQKSKFIDNNSEFLYKFLDEEIEADCNDQLCTNSAIKSMILREIPTSKRRMILDLFYKGLGFDANDGPSDRALHCSVFEMIKRYLKVYQSPNHTSFRPLHLALDIVLQHKNKLLGEQFASSRSDSELDNSNLKFRLALKMVNYLLESGSDPNEPDENGKTPLYRIVNHLKRFLTWELGSTSGSSSNTAYMLVILFLRHGAEINFDYENPDDDPFRISMSYASRTVVQLYIEHGYDLKKFSPKIFPPRTCLSWFGLFELLVNADVFDLEATGKQDGQTVLIIVLEHAVSKSLKSEIETLVKNGSDVNAVDKGGGRDIDESTALHVCGGHEGDDDIQLESDTAKHYANLLLARGANIDCLNKYNETPLHCAAKKYKNEIVKFLLSRGASINLRTSYYSVPSRLRYLPLELARGHKTITEQLIVAHIALLEKQNLHVDPQNYNIISSEPTLREYYVSCKTELELAQTTILDSWNRRSITFYDILTANRVRMRQHAGRPSMQTSFQVRDPQRLFPIYGQQMSQRLADARREFELLFCAVPGLARIFKSSSDFHMVYGRIMTYLCELDLSNLAKV
ncbi:hypothetical protein QAD02_019527 [Eretmocerus hayati]|uniref:Uncharacterized protein n=1 Tax=Eretmocerus hayati TaxID=131215 RepID=A0ACC2PJX9_9HYME|nr:hypothetical protein QAD02_019527 [Eretmocerus hayati]